MLEVVGVRPVQEHPQEQVVVGEPFANGRQQQRHGLQAEPVELVQEACGDFTPTIPLESKCKYYNNNNKITRFIRDFVNSIYAGIERLINMHI